MRIIYLHQYFTVPSEAGGTRSYEFARRLVDSGHEVVMITSTAMLPPPYRSSKRVETFVCDGINVVAIPLEYSNSMGFAQRVNAFIKFAFRSSVEVIKHPADVIFATSTPLTIAIPGIVGKLWHRKPLVFEVRDLWPEVPIALGALRNPLLRHMAFFLEWLAYQNSKHIIALSPGMKEGIKRRGIADDCITVIPNSADLELFGITHVSGNEVREQLRIKLEQPLIVYTGTFGTVNGIGYLVSIAAEMIKINPSIHFLLVGNGKEEEQIKDKALTLGVLDVNLSIWKPLPKTQIAQVLATATIATSFVIPVRELENNSANKFFDALAAGRPVAINYGGWQRDILIESGAGIMISPDNAHEAAMALAQFVTDENAIKLAQNASKRLAITQFSRDKLFENFERVLLNANK